VTREEAAANLLQYLKENEKPDSVWAKSLDMAISALRKQESLEKKQATKTSDWISVKDRRPEYKTRVLFVDVRGLVFLAIDSVDWDDGRVSFLEPASGLWVQGSHWMPLPEPPKEDMT